VLKAFGVAADSQGCMNNITFGQNDWGYYETVAGGAGAVSPWGESYIIFYLNHLTSIDVYICILRLRPHRALTYVYIFLLLMFFH